MVHFIYGRTGSGKSRYVYSLAEESVGFEDFFIERLGK